jgi:DNA excision repair protein ERCC-2
MDIKMLKDIFFPYSNIRDVQKEMVLKVKKCLEEKKHLLIHAPTGLGKTAASLAPALSFALNNEITIFFLTSRHTQHKIAVDTLMEIKKKHGIDFSAVDVVGKKFMCMMPNASKMYSNEFNDYCNKIKEDKKCDFFNRIKEKGKLSVITEKLLEELKIISPSHSEKIIEICKREGLCAYEISALLSKKAKIIIADYNYIFDPYIRSNFFKRTGIKLEKSIIIVDEAHNLPKRIRDMLTKRISDVIIERAIKEAKKYGCNDVIEKLDFLKTLLINLAKDLDEKTKEKLIEKNTIINKINDKYEYICLISDFNFIGEDIREDQGYSYIGGIANFLSSWCGEDYGFARILTKTDKNIILSYRCLDPSIVAKEVVNNAYSILCMSGTLTPTLMYNDILGFNDAEQENYNSPFPRRNRLNLIIPKTTTKYTMRNEAQFKEIAKICAEIVNIIPGNSALFFPSYAIMKFVNNFFMHQCKRKIFFEDPKMDKEQRYRLLEEFKRYKEQGAVLMGVASGSFSQGVDLPGDFLKCVVVVGLPLEPPDLETKELIKYYEGKFCKGWDYGYILPAITKVLQSAGRCIRSERDKGFIVFLDERYAWRNYLKCFPSDWDVKISVNYEKYIRHFFNNITKS